jgi:hypothetical protein
MGKYYIRAVYAVSPGWDLTQGSPKAQGGVTLGPEQGEPGADFC